MHKPLAVTVFESAAERRESFLVRDPLTEGRATEALLLSSHCRLFRCIHNCVSVACCLSYAIDLCLSVSVAGSC